MGKEVSVGLNLQDPGHVYDRSGEAVVLLLGTVPCVYTNTGGPGPNTDTAIGSAALFEEISSCFIWETNKSTNQACTSKDHQQVRELHHGAWDAAGKTQTRCISCSPACGSPLAAGDSAQLQSWGCVYSFEA